LCTALAAKARQLRALAYPALGALAPLKWRHGQDLLPWACWLAAPRARGAAAPPLQILPSSLSPRSNAARTETGRKEGKREEEESAQAAKVRIRSVRVTMPWMVPFSATTGSAPTCSLSMRWAASLALMAGWPVTTWRRM